eukprot:jgi/Ulvmu1/1401/UM011_0129.1
MAVTAAQIQEKLISKLEAVAVDVQDTSGGCGASFSVSVVSPQFEGMKLIARHRAINSALKEEIQQIHALQIAKCEVPAKSFVHSPNVS